MPKQDCKYWDKCYQKNEQHLQKYNHPTKLDAEQDDDHLESNLKVAPKRKRSADTNAAESKPTKEKEEKATTSNKTATTSATPTEKSLEAEEDKQTTEDKYETAELRKKALGQIAGKNYMKMLEKRIRLSEQNEYDNLVRSGVEFLRHKFLVEMPPDFYVFWKFISELNKDANAEEVLKYVAKQFQLQLVGPFEFLAGRFHDAKLYEPGQYLRHWRFYYDPPEFQTIFVRTKTGVHYGYWRDTPKDKEHLLVARNDSESGCEFEFVAGNAFDAFLYFLENDFVGSPFTAATVASTKKALSKFIEINSVQLEKLDKLQKVRNKKVVAKTFHRAGIVVPFESKSQLGYRPLIVSDAELKKILQLFEHGDKKDDGSADENIRKVVLEKLQPVVNAASIAVDECDFGTSFELGIDIFCSGHKELHMLVSSLLVPAYTLLSRPQFIAIAKAHLENRRKDVNLSIFSSLN